LVKKNSEFYADFIKVNIPEEQDPPPPQKKERSFLQINKSFSRDENDALFIRDVRDNP
jgi:hypothetical protein